MDDAWLGQLYERYGFLVHRRCMQLVRRPEDAEDALQETFLRVKRYGPPRDGEATLAWLYTVAARCCFDLMEKRGREPVADDSQLAAVEELGGGCAEDADRRALLGAALRTLDGKTRTIGVLHYLDGYTQEEVAEQTGFSRKTVGKKLKTFEDRIRQLFTGRDNETRR